MRMWRKLAPREYGFFDLFNRHANTTLEGTRRLVSLVESWPNGQKEMSRIEELEHECDSITHMTIDLLHRTFITPLDRDEIHNLISKLDDIMDTVEVAARRMQLFEIQSVPGNLVEMVRVLNQSTELVVQAVNLLKNLKHTEELQDLFKEINRLENVGDALFHAALLDLFKNNANDPLTLIKLKEIFETIEWAIDRCEDVANTVEGIVLEHF
jgi:predicted phosphate transport protein (TIGR00153 family)